VAILVYSGAGILFILEVGRELDRGREKKRARERERKENNSEHT